MSLRPELLAAPRYHFSARNAAVKLDQNESPYDLPDDLKAVILARLSRLAFNRYPDLRAETLRDKLAERCGWPPDGLVVAGGSNVLIQAIVIAAGLGRTVLTLKPTFSIYGLQARLLGAKLLECPLEDDFSLPVAALEGELARGTGVLFLAQPAAPTGNRHPWQDLERLAEAAAGNWLFALDEAYHQFSDGDGLPLLRRYPHLVSLRTFSKACGLAGARLGYMLAQPAIAQEVQKAILPFSVSALQLVVGEALLEQGDLVGERIAEILQERERVFGALDALPGLIAYPSEANFILFRVEDAAEVYAGLLERGVVIRRQDHLPGLAGCLRVSIGRPEENDAFLKAIDDLCARPLAEVRGG